MEQVKPNTEAKYKIIHDLEALEAFVEWLPALKKHETYYVSLIARRKYNKTQAEDKLPVKRFTSDKSRLIEKIKQLEAPINCYLDSKKQPIPQEGLVLYISINPRDLEKAAHTIIDTLNKKTRQPYTNYLPHKIALSAIQDTRSRRCFVDIDHDDAEADTQDLMEKFGQILNPQAFSILKTRGGHHILVNIPKIQKSRLKTWYIELTNLVTIDVKGDNLTPVPGCCQGGFVPVLYHGVDHIKEEK